MDRSYYLENLGCAKNQVDAEIMISALRKAGWRRVEEPSDAAVIIVNSCGFIRPAKEESITTSLELHESFPGAKIVLSGCLSQRYGSEIVGQMPELSGVFGNRRPELIGELLERVLESPGELFLPALEPAGGTWSLPHRSELLSLPGSAYVKIAEGCNNRCSFCAIPLIRGNLRSRTMAEVVDEIRLLTGRGIREINLVAHDLNSYGRDLRPQKGERSGEQATLPELIRRISAISGRFWIRLLYLYPESFHPEVLELLRSDPRFLPYFDLPMQHASAGILEAMGRTGRREGYLDLLARIREAVPSVVLRSTLLVGYPGETERDFDELLDFQSQAAFDWLGVFAFSPEEGTRAYTQQRARGRVPSRIAEERRSVLVQAQESITEKGLDRFVGSEMEVLVEEAVEGEDLFLARGYPHAPEVDGLVVVRASGLPVGEFIRVRIVQRNGIDLEALPVAVRGAGTDAPGSADAGA